MSVLGLHQQFSRTAALGTAVNILRPSKASLTIQPTPVGRLLTPGAGLPIVPTREASLTPTERSAARAVADKKRLERLPPSLAVYVLGHFYVACDNQLLNKWPSGRGKAIFKYLVANRGRPIAKEVLMDLFWPDTDPTAARNNLNVAIHGLRQAFRSVRPDSRYILFQDDRYLLNPDLAWWVDFEEFVQRDKVGQRLEQQGKLAGALWEYEQAACLYQGDFLEEDQYEDWPILLRERLKESYLVVLDRLSRAYLEEEHYIACIYLCQKILVKDDCREDAHRRLMRCYSRQGQHHLALRQYQLCVETLAQTVDVAPMPKTTALYLQIRRREAV